MGRIKKVKSEETKQETTKKEVDVNVINKQIVDISQVEKLVDVFIIDTPTYDHPYIDYTDKLKSIFKRLIHSVQVDTSRVTVSITQDQIEQLKSEHNTDAYALIENIIINEVGQGFSEHVISKIRNITENTYQQEFTSLDKIKTWAYKLVKKEYKKYIEVSTVKELLAAIIRESNIIALKSKMGYGNFAICSVKTATMLQQESRFAMALTEEIIPPPGSIYPFGKMAGITFYANPHMLWTDNNIYIGRKTKADHPGIKVFIYKNGAKTKVEVEGTGAPKVVFYYMYTVVLVGNSADLLYRKIEYKDNLKNPIL